MMDASALRVLARQTYEAVEPHGPAVAADMAALLIEQGLVAGAHEGDDPDSFDEVKTLEWALGQFISLAEAKAWFAMNSMLNRLHELGQEPVDA
jgi:hypothetical protein